MTKRLTILLALVLAGAMIAGLAGCEQDSVTKNTAATLKASKGTWEALQIQAAKLYLAGKITDAEWQQFVGIDRRFTATHNAAVEAFRIYLDAKDKDPQATWAQHGLNVAIENVWTVIREAQALIDAWSNRAE